MLVRCDLRSGKLLAALTQLWFPRLQRPSKVYIPPQPQLLTNLLKSCSQKESVMSCASYPLKYPFLPEARLHSNPQAYGTFLRPANPWATPCLPLMGFFIKHCSAQCFELRYDSLMNRRLSNICALLLGAPVLATALPAQQTGLRDLHCTGSVLLCYCW